MPMLVTALYSPTPPFYITRYSRIISPLTPTTSITENGPCSPRRRRRQTRVSVVVINPLRCPLLRRTHLAIERSFDGTIGTPLSHPLRLPAQSVSKFSIFFFPFFLQNTRVLCHGASTGIKRPRPLARILSNFLTRSTLLLSTTMADR